jgi:hypothetical protein
MDQLEPDVAAARRPEPEALRLAPPRDLPSESGIPVFDAKSVSIY